MAANYCDFISGSDATGDGSKENPYQWIGAASTGLSPGDEVRCAKTPAHTTNLLGASWTWTHASPYVTAPSDPTGTVAVGDNVRLAAYPDRWFRVVAVSSSPARIQIGGYYYGPTLTAQTDLMGCASVDLSAAPYTQNQFNSSGIDGNQIRVSGGWNLSTETQDGETWLSQFKPGTPNGKYNYGLHLSHCSYITTEDLGFIGCNYSVYVNNASASGSPGGDMEFNRVKSCYSNVGYYIYQTATISIPGVYSFTDSVDVGDNTAGIYLYRMNFVESITIGGCEFYESARGIYLYELYGYKYSTTQDYPTLDDVTITDATFDGCNYALATHEVLGSLTPTGTVTRCLYLLYAGGEQKRAEYNLGSLPAYDTRANLLYGTAGSRIVNVTVDGAIPTNPSAVYGTAGYTVHNLNISNWPSGWRLFYGDNVGGRVTRLKCNQITDGYERTPLFGNYGTSQPASHRPVVSVEGIYDPTEEVYVDQFIGYRDGFQTVMSRDWTLLYEDEPSCRVRQRGAEATVTAFDVYAQPATAATVTFQVRGDAEFTAMTDGYFQAALEQGGKIVTAWADVDFTDDAWTENEISIGAGDWENGTGLLTLLLRTGNLGASPPFYNVAGIEVS